MTSDATNKLAMPSPQIKIGKKVKAKAHLQANECFHGSWDHGIWSIKMFRKKRHVQLQYRVTSTLIFRNFKSLWSNYRFRFSSIPKPCMLVNLWIPETNNQGTSPINKNYSIPLQTKPEKQIHHTGDGFDRSYQAGNRYKSAAAFSSGPEQTFCRQILSSWRKLRNKRNKFFSCMSGNISTKKLHLLSKSWHRFCWSSHPEWTQFSLDLKECNPRHSGLLFQPPKYQL